MKAAPTMAVKELNKRALTRYLYANGPATKQVLERELGLSLPTITQESARARTGRSCRQRRATGIHGRQEGADLRVQVPVQSSHRRLHALQ